jgi:crotonobetainyl-CoA:carnitine CoA-transferase CaiB-like acyl-CoA transferase
MSGYLSGVRVLDLSRLLPGPYAGLMLAEMGADVIKVENIAGGGDYARQLPPLIDGIGGLFLSMNRGKRNVALNFRSPEGLSVLRKLALASDVVLDSFRPGVLKSLNLEPESLLREKPGLIICSVTGYGQRGPLAAKAGHDLNYQALTGMLDMTGSGGENPGLPGIQAADLAGGSQAAVIAILAALLRRERTGKGEWLDVAMCDTLVSLQPFTMMDAALGGRPRHGQALLHGRYACYNVYKTKDGRHMALAALEPKFFKSFCTAIDKPELMAHHFALAIEGEPGYEALKAEFASRSQKEWVELLAGADACCEPVVNSADLRTHPYCVARGLFEVSKDPRLPQLSSAPALKHRSRTESAAEMGSHTRDVLSEAGFSQHEIDILHAQGAVKSAD